MESSTALANEDKWLSMLKIKQRCKMSSLVKTSLKNQGTRVAWEPSDGLAVFEDCVTRQNSFRGFQRSPGTTGNQTHSTSQSPRSRVLDYFYPRFHCTHPICSRWTCQ